MKWLLGFLGPWASVPALIAYAFVGGLGAGGYGVHTWYKAQKVAKVEDARKMERTGVAKANQADVRYIDRLTEQRDQANANADKWKKEFDRVSVSLRRCTVSPTLLGMLNDGRSGATAGTAPKPSPTPAPVEAGSNCAAVIETEQWNKENVVLPNQIQIEELQRFYEEQRRLFNKRR